MDIISSRAHCFFAAKLPQCIFPIPNFSKPEEVQGLCLFTWLVSNLTIGVTPRLYRNRIPLEAEQIGPLDSSYQSRERGSNPEDVPNGEAGTLRLPIVAFRAHAVTFEGLTKGTAITGTLRGRTYTCRDEIERLNLDAVVEQVAAAE